MWIPKNFCGRIALRTWTICSYLVGISYILGASAYYEGLDTKSNEDVGDPQGEIGPLVLNTLMNDDVNFVYSAECRYSAYERDLVGIVWAVGKW